MKPPDAILWRHGSFVTSRDARPSRCRQVGRVTPCAPQMGNGHPERRARSDAPYQAMYRIFFVTVLHACGVILPLPFGRGENPPKHEVLSKPRPLRAAGLQMRVLGRNLVGRVPTRGVRLGFETGSHDPRIEPLNRTTAASPSPPDVRGRRGPGRGGFEFAGLPLSPALSPLVPRGERETIGARSAQVHGTLPDPFGRAHCPRTARSERRAPSRPVGMPFEKRAEAVLGAPVHGRVRGCAKLHGRAAVSSSPPPRGRGRTSRPTFGPVVHPTDPSAKDRR